MKIIEAIGFIGDICVRMFCLVILIAESVVPMGSKAAWDYIESQRKWINKQQDMLELEAMVNDAMAGCDAE